VFEERARRVMEGMQRWVNAGPGTDVLEETGPAKVTEKVPKGCSQLTKIAGNRHLLVRVTGLGVGWPRAPLLRRALPPPSRAGSGGGHGGGAGAVNCRGHEFGEDRFVGRGRRNVGVLAVAILVT
jgi:hypothetical protein